MNQAEFFQANQVDGQLTDAQMMQMVNLQEGDTLALLSQATKEISVPDADVVQTANVVETKSEPELTLLAKDGVHVIPYEKLTEAREDAQYWKQVAAEMQAQMGAAPRADPITPAKPAEPAPDEDLFGDYSEQAIKSGVEKLVASQVGVIRSEMEAKLAAALAPSQQAAAESATDSHFSVIEKAHPDVESVVQSIEMDNWIGKQPSFVQDQYRTVIADGSAAQVIELLDTFKSAIGKTTTPAPGGNTSAMAAAAAAAIAKAKSSPPSSLSEIPASTGAHHDPTEAMLEMSPAGLMRMLEVKSPEQIAALMTKTL